MAKAKSTRESTDTTRRLRKVGPDTPEYAKRLEDAKTPKPRKAAPDVPGRLASAPARWEARERVHAKNVAARRVDGPSEFDVQLIRGGVMALLTCADLSSDDGAARLLGAFGLYEPDAKKPSLAKLGLAKTIVLMLEDAILSGEDAPAWKVIERATKELRSTQHARSIVVGILRRIHETAEYYVRVAKGAEGTRDVEGPTLEDHAGDAIAQLKSVDLRFGNVAVADFVALLRHSKLQAIGLAAKTSLTCGAFDDAKRPKESAPAAFKRIKKLYEKAVNEVPPS